MAFLRTGDKGKIGTETIRTLSPYLPEDRRWGEGGGEAKNFKHLFLESKPTRLSYTFALHI